jgi:hypothetical protein
MIDNSPVHLFEVRARELSKWLEDAAPYVQFDQHHLDAGTPAQAYWHLGYRAALIDALTLLKNAADGSDGISTRSPSDDPDA